MIVLINNQNRHDFPELVDDMFRVRADVFKTRLNWDVMVRHDREIDRFDYSSPTYVASVCEDTGRFQGSVRLLPTEGPNMLRDVFAELLDGGPMVEHPRIWESSRFSLSSSPLDGPHAGSMVNDATIELLLGIVECAQRNGISHIVSVYDARMARLFRSIDCDAVPVGTPRRIGGVMTHAGIFPANDALWATLAARIGVDAPVVSDHWRPSIVARPRQSCRHDAVLEAA